MKATLISYGAGVSGGKPPADEYLDVRAIRNPWSNKALRGPTGLDPRVQAYIENDPNTLKVMGLARLALREGVTLAFGCFGGRHRSVAVVEMLADALRKEGWQIETRHTQLVDYDLVHA